jgi:hypothetical protein
VHVTRQPLCELIHLSGRGVQSLRQFGQIGIALGPSAKQWSELTFDGFPEYRDVAIDDALKVAF